MKNPIFVVGSGRSGTTLLQRMMRSHSRISSPTGESHFFIPLYENRALYGDLTVVENVKKTLEEMRRISREYVEEDLKGLAFDVDALAEEFTDEGKNNMVALISWLMEKNATGEGKRRWLEKTPYYILHMETILEMFPDAQFIHIIRDGRDCALSMLQRKHDLKIFNTYHAAQVWKQYVEAGQQTGKQLQAKQYFELRYEDLIDDPDKTMRRICEFIDEKFEPSMVQFEKSKDPKSKTPMLSKSIQKKNSEKWRDRMSNWSIRVFESEAGQTLKENGYPLTTSCNTLPAPVLAVYKIHERYNRNLR